MIQALLSKLSYYDSKIKKGKEDFEELLRMFEAATKNSDGHNLKMEMQKQV